MGLERLRDVSKNRVYGLGNLGLGSYWPNPLVNT